MKFETGDEVEIVNINKQSMLEEIGYTGLDTFGDYVGFRGRGNYMSVSGLITRIGCKGEIYKILNLQDDKLEGNWYEVYVNTSLACYQYLNFHESELQLISNAYPIVSWLER